MVRSFLTAPRVQFADQKILFDHPIDRLPRVGVAYLANVILYFLPLIPPAYDTIGTWSDIGKTTARS